MTELEKYYNKFDEDHRLTTRHGQVEFNTSMKFIHDYIPEGSKLKILDVGAGTGRYSVPLSQEGHSVTAVELVEHNLKVLESKHASVNCWPGDARDLHFLEDGTFDITLLFGPMYHLHTREDQVKALVEAKRVTKKGGKIFVAYVMNEYSIIQYCFKKNVIRECLEKGWVTSDFHTVPSEDQLYTYLRLEDIDAINKETNSRRIKIFAADGPSDYMRRELNAMDQETFNIFMQYHLDTCERPELLGASSHLVDVLLN
ncbi:MAG: methyltransferase domain-containing protein [Treponema sp.]|nr:methyltransferase domain-containing protein [Treponema sp.]